MLNPHQQGFAKLVTMIEALDVGMLTTEDENGQLRSRPMATQKAEGSVLYFFTRAHSAIIAEIRKDPQVNVSYADPSNEVYVSVSGLAKTVHDRAKVHEFWTSGAQRWFPQGPDDPQLSILAVEISRAEYWDVDKLAMIRLLEKGAGAEEIISATDHKKLP